MDVHEQVRGLVEAMGPRVLEDADGLRGALDDYLDEDAASVGDINLIIDAVRLGAYRSFNDMVSAGAAPGPALDEVGARLARDRGSADVAGSSWALAVLGFAADRVGDADVRRFRSIHTSRRTPPPSPAQPTQAPPVQQSWAPPQPHAQPPSQPQPQPQAQPQSWGQPNATQSWGQPNRPAQGGRRTGLIIAAVVAVLVVISGGVGLALALGGDDGSTLAGEERSATDEPTDEPTDGPTDGPTEDYTPTPAGVCEADAQGYAAALTRFSPKYTAASDRLLNGVENTIFAETQAGAYDMRAAIYDFDAEVRDLDLSAIQLTVNDLLIVNGTMIAELDQVQNTVTSQEAIRKVADLPSEDFISAFTEVATQIDEHPGGC